MNDVNDDAGRMIELVWSQREIERMIYAVGYAIEDGDFQRVGDVMGDATMGADLIGRKAFKGSTEIRDQYARTNIVYPGRGRAVEGDLPQHPGRHRPRRRHRDVGDELHGRPPASR